MNATQNKNEVKGIKGNKTIQKYLQRIGRFGVVAASVPFWIACSQGFTPQALTSASTEDTMGFTSACQQGCFPDGSAPSTPNANGSLTLQANNQSGNAVLSLQSGNALI